MDCMIDLFESTSFKHTLFKRRIKCFFTRCIKVNLLTRVIHDSVILNEKYVEAVNVLLKHFQIWNYFNLLQKIVFNKLFNSNVPQDTETCKSLSIYTIIQTRLLIPLNVCKCLHSPRMFIVQLYNFMPQAY